MTSGSSTVEVSAEGVEPPTLDATVRAGVTPADESRAATTR
jgi:hypothetical protein